MSLYNDLNSVLTPYANKIKQNEANVRLALSLEGGGAPTVVSNISAMTNTSQIYVLTTDGNWYYYDGTEWTSGGEYGTVATDKTLTLEDSPADAKAVGDAVSEIRRNVSGAPKIVDTEDDTEADLYICDEGGNVIAKLQDGDIVTKNFDSSTLTAEFAKKINLQQGVANKGKALVVGNDGNVDLADISINVDKTLTKDGEAADAKVTGEKIGVLESDISKVPSITSPNVQDVDLFVCDTQGNVLAELADGHIRTKNFDSSNIDVDSPVKEASKTDADLYICDSFGNVVAEFKDGHIVTKKFDSGDYMDTLDNIESLLTDVSDLKTATSGIVYRNRDVTDGVYAACRYHQPSLSAKQFCMLIAGDIHTDPTRMQSMIEYLNAVDAFDCGIMLGDISGNTFNDPITYYADAISGTNKPYLTVLGNHDVANGATSDADLWGKYGTLFEYADLSNGELVSGKCYYHKDFATYKIRLIALMQYDYIYDGGLCFGQTQIDWLIQTLLSTPSDYGVIICEHTDPSRNMTYNMDVAYTSDTWRQSNYAPTYMVGDPVPDIVDAWVNGNSLTKTYAYTFSNAPADLSVSADFSNRGTGEFITYLGGHWHMDVLGHPTEYANQPDYHVPAAGLSAATQGDIPRRSRTLSEDSFCAIGIDRDKKMVKVFHIGAYRTKDAIDRQYFKYSYGGSNA